MSNPKNLCQLLFLLAMIFNSCVKFDESDHAFRLPERTAIHQISIGEVLSYVAHHKKEEFVSFGAGVSVNILDYLDWSNYSVCTSKNGNQILLIPIEDNSDLMQYDGSISGAKLAFFKDDSANVQSKLYIYFGESTLDTLSDESEFDHFKGFVFSYDGD